MITITFSKPFHNRYLSTFRAADVLLVAEPVAPTSSPGCASLMKNTAIPSVYFSRSLSPTGPCMIYRLVRMRFPKNTKFHGYLDAFGTASESDSEVLLLISSLMNSALAPADITFTESLTSVAHTSLRQVLLKFGASLLNSLPTVGWTALYTPGGVRTGR